MIEGIDKHLGTVKRQMGQVQRLKAELEVARARFQDQEKQSATTADTLKDLVDKLKVAKSAFNEAFPLVEGDSGDGAVSPFPQSPSPEAVYSLAVAFRDVTEVLGDPSLLTGRLAEVLAKGSAI